MRLWAARKLARTIFGWLAKAAAGFCATAIALIMVLLVVMWRQHSTKIVLPIPTGHFAVGRTMFVWSSEAQADELASSPGTTRQVVVWIWYPAIYSQNEAPAEYLPSEWRDALRTHQGVFMSSFFKRDPAVVTPHSISNTPLAPEQRAYPVVLLRAGGGALTTDFTTLAEDLASHGYFVVGFDAPYRSFVVVLPDGRVVARSAAYNVESANGNLADPVIDKLLAMWVSDAKFVINQLERLNQGSSERFVGGTLEGERFSWERFAGRMDLNRLGIFGHSFGGATALEFCHEDSRCKAAADLDGIPFGSVVREGLAKPCMFLLSDHSREMADPSSKQVLGEIASIYERVPNGRLYAVIRTANHFSFSDQILLNSPIAITLLRHSRRFGALDGRRGLAISADYVDTFFDVYLSHASEASLISLAGKYPEMEIEGR